MSAQITDESALETSQERKTKIRVGEKPVEPDNMIFRMLIGLLCLTVMITGGGTLIILIQGEAVSTIFIVFGAATIGALVALSYLLNTRK